MMNELSQKPFNIYEDNHIIFYWNIMLYKVVLVPAVQCESAIGMHIILLLQPPSHHPHPMQVITEHRAELPKLHSSFPPALHFTRGNVYMYVNATLSR